MLLSPPFEMAQSKWPSPLKSPVATAVGRNPAGRVGRSAKLLSAESLIIRDGRDRRPAGTLGVPGRHAPPQDRLKLSPALAACFHPRNRGWKLKLLLFSDLSSCFAFGGTNFSGRDCW